MRGRDRGAARDVAFDALYHATREDLLGQCFLLSGDPAAAVTATRHAYAAAYARGPRLDADPSAWLRQVAWRAALKRRGRRTPPTGPVVVTVLAGLAPRTRRLVVLVHHLGFRPEDASVELGLTETAGLALLREAETRLAEHGLTDLGAALREASTHVPVSALPATGDVLRSGRRRRRGQAVTAAVVVVALTTGAGALGHQPPPSARSPEAAATVPDRDLLDAAALAPLSRSPWRVRVDAPARVPCLPDAASAAERVLRSSAPAVAVRQRVALVADGRQARSTYAGTVAALAACPLPRLHLATVLRVAGVGDAAVMLRLQLPGRRVPWLQVGLARSGTTVTTVAVTSVRAAPDRAVVRVLATAVRRLCDGNRCVGRPRSARAVPPPAGSAPGFLAVVDLPPLVGVQAPWAATRVVRVGGPNPAVTTCAETPLTRASARSRTFVVPGSRLPVEFGVTETIADLGTPRAARRVLDTATRRLSRCARETQTTQVVAGPGRTWTVTSEVSDRAALRFRTGLVRRGRLVAQITLVPTAGTDLGDRRFAALVRRAEQRLREVD